MTQPNNNNKMYCRNIYQGFSQMMHIFFLLEKTPDCV